MVGDALLSGEGFGSIDLLARPAAFLLVHAHSVADDILPRGELLTAAVLAVRPAPIIIW